MYFHQAQFFSEDEMYEMKNIKKALIGYMKFGVNVRESYILQLRLLKTLMPEVLAFQDESLERFTGGETDDAALTAMARNAPASTVNRDEESSWNRVWAGLGRELLDPASGATADITGLTLSHDPTAGGWITICRRPAWSKGDKGPTYTPEKIGRAHV